MRIAARSLLLVSLSLAACIEGPPPLPAAPVPAGGEGDPVAASTGSITGHFCNARSGETVLGGVVTLSLPAGDDVVVTTDASTGVFVLDDVPAGHHRLVVEYDGLRRSVEVDVVAQEESLLDPGECVAFDPLTTGMILGSVCTPDGAPALGARVFVVGEIDGATFEGEADEAGAFFIAGIPTPQPPLQVRAERGLFVFTWSNVPVFSIADAPDGTLLTPGGCAPLLADDNRRVLVVDGVFGDTAGELDRMALNIDVIDGVPANPTDDWMIEAFGNFDALAGYDAVVVESGVNEADFILGVSPAIKQNLRSYLDDGGSLYVIGWSYDLIEAVFPERVDFFGDDEDPSAAERAADGVYQARLLDAALANYVGSDSAEVALPQSSVVIDAVADDVTAYADAIVDVASDGGTAAQRTPLAIGFDVGAGRVLFDAIDCAQAGCTSDSELRRYLLFSL